MQGNTPFRPIQTRWNNVTYRSRLESRWGAFWRSLDIPAEYEPCGYDIGDDKPYLVDFWLPSWDVYAEIKPTGVDLSVARARVKGLARAREKLVLLIVGAPNENWYTVEVYGERDRVQYVIEGGHFAECPRCDGFGIVSAWGWTALGEHACQADVVPLHDPVNAPRLFRAYTDAYSLYGDARPSA